MSVTIIGWVILFVLLAVGIMSIPPDPPHDPVQERIDIMREIKKNR